MQTIQSSRGRRAAHRAQPAIVRKPARHWRAAAAAMALGCVAASAQAASFFEVEAGIGGSAYAEGSDGLWLQKGLPHETQFTAPAVEAGITGDVTSWLSWHLDYAWLGTIHSQGLATSDANYNLATRSVRVSMPLANFTGSGHDQGFLFTLEPHYDVGQWRFGFEIGPYVHRATWTVDATNQVNFIGQTPYSSHFVTNPVWALGGVAGVSVSYKRFSLRYQFFQNGSRRSDPAPQIWKNTHVLTLGYRF